MEDGEGGDEICRELAVGCAWTGNSARVVVTENDRAGVVMQDSTQHFALVDSGSVDGPLRDCFAGEDVMSAAQEEHDKVLDGVVAKIRCQVLHELLRILERLAAFDRRRDVPAPDFRGDP